MMKSLNCFYIFYSRIVFYSAWLQRGNTPIGENFPPKWWDDRRSNVEVSIIVNMYVYVCIYVCMYVCKFICVYELCRCVFIYLYMCTYDLCACMYMYVCLLIYLDIFIHLYIQAYVHTKMLYTLWEETILIKRNASLIRRYAMI